MAKSKEKVRVPGLLAMKRAGQKITALTAYDASMARILDRAGIDVLLVGDSLGMVVQGDATTVGVTLDAMVHHCRAVANGSSRALIVADLPFLTYQTGAADALRSAGRLMQQGRAEAVKMEGGAEIRGAVRALSGAGIPVMGHLGLLPQHVHRLGGYRAAGRSSDEAERLAADAAALEKAGAFALVLECIPADLARRVSRELSIPTIGIGAGPHCDGQILVSYDAFGLYASSVPRFVKQYADLSATITLAAQSYIEDVRSQAFPSSEHSIGASPSVSGGA